MRRGPAAAPAAPEPAYPNEAYNTRVNTAHGAAQALAINLVNPFLGIDLIRLGASNFEIALLSALPPLAATISNIGGARWLARRPEPKRAGAAMFLTARLAVIGFALLNLGLGPRARPSPWRAMAMVVLVGVLNIPNAVGNLSWQALITGLLGSSRRARALASRSMVASLAGVAAVLLAGWWIRTRLDPGAYSWLYLLGALAGVAEVSIFLRLRGNPVVQSLPTHLRPAITRLWRDLPYRAYTLACLPFYFGWLMAWPLFLRYQVTIAHATNLWIGVFTAVNALSAALGNLIWSRIGDRIGPKLALPLAIAGLAGVPLSYSFAPGFWGLVGTNALGGLMGGGVNLLLLVRLMEVAPEADRVVAMGIANTMIGAIGVAGPLLGIVLLRFLPMPQIFVVPAALRLCGGLALLAASATFAGRGPRVGTAAG